MSIDTSLKSRGGLAQHRNVLTRAERIAKLADQGKFDPENGQALGLPKVTNKKLVTGKKTKKKGPEDADADGKG